MSNDIFFLLYYEMEKHLAIGESIVSIIAKIKDDCKVSSLNTSLCLIHFEPYHGAWIITDIRGIRNCRIRRISFNL